MQTALTLNIIPTKRTEPSKINEKKVKFSPKQKKIKKKIYFFSVITKNISSRVLKISAISFVLRTRDITDIFNTFDEMLLVFTSEK